jgi:hypothetical protein
LICYNPTGNNARGAPVETCETVLEAARPALEALLQEITGVTVLSRHHGVRAHAGEDVVMHFTLVELLDNTACPAVTNARTT